MIHHASDIQIFVLTYNRRTMLEETLYSLQRQWVKGFEVHILDNGSTDDTLTLASAYPTFHFHVSPTGENMGQEANFARAKAMATAPWVMVFHDDDTLHPQAIGMMLQAINTHANEQVALVGCRYQETQQPNNHEWAAPPDPTYYHCPTPADLATLFLLDYPYHFGSSLMKQQAFIAHEYDYTTYDKIMDRPFLLDAASHGSTLVLDAPLVQYRVHPGQDSLSTETAPQRQHWLAVMKRYHAAMHDDNATKGHASLYRSRALGFLKAGFDWLSSTEEAPDFKAWIKDAKAEGILSFQDVAYAKLFQNKITRGLGKKQEAKLVEAFYAETLKRLTPQPTLNPVATHIKLP
jgi:glycosyltransferase involved in cell wall biosynthesis